MKKLWLLLLIPLLAGKSVTVNPAYPGKYKFTDPTSGQMTIWILTMNPKAANEIDFRRTVDKDPLFTVQMEDATHFKTKHEFVEHISDIVDVRRTCSGIFADGEMTLLIKYESITFGMRKNLTRHTESEHVFKKMGDKEPMPEQSQDSVTISH